MFSCLVPNTRCVFGWTRTSLIYGLTPVDVINAIKVQNNQVAAGQLGGTASSEQELNSSIIAQTRLTMRKNSAKSC